MSMQFSLFVLPDEQPSIVRLIESVGPVRWMAERTNSREPGTLDLSSLRPRTLDWRHSFIARECDTHLATRHQLTGRPEWFLDRERSPIIEYARWNGEDRVPGRLYCQTRYFDEHGQMIMFDPEFIRWVRAVFRKVKTALHYDPTAFAYYTPAAKEVLLSRSRAARSAAVSQRPPMEQGP